MNREKQPPPPPPGVSVATVSNFTIGKQRSSLAQGLQVGAQKKVKFPNANLALCLHSLECFLLNETSQKMDTTINVFLEKHHQNIYSLIYAI